MEPLPSVSDMLQHFQTILPSAKGLNDLLKRKYILWVVALLDACDVITNNGPQLGFFQELGIRLKS